MDSCDRIERSKICDVMIKKHKWMRLSMKIR